MFNAMLRENRAGGLTLPNFETYCKATVTKRVWYWRRDRQPAPPNRGESPEIDPCKCSHLIFDRGAQTIKWSTGSLFDK